MFWRAVPSAIRLPARRLVSPAFIDWATIASAPKRRAEPGSEVTVVGFHHTISGLGASARLCAAGLEACGHKVNRVDVSSLFGLREHFCSGIGIGDVNRSLTGDVVVHLNPPELTELLRQVGHEFFRRCRVIGYWAWELERAPQQWSIAARWVDEIWALSSFSAAAFELLAPHKCVRVVHPPVWTFDTAGTRANSVAEPGRPYTFVTCFDARSSLARKNPFGAVEAFKRAFPKPSGLARLALKCTAIDADVREHQRLIHEAGGRADIQFCYEELGADEMRSFLIDADAVISLHRAEGFGLVLAEAISAGLPVVATAWSGNMDFVSPEGSYLVGYDLAPVGKYAGVKGGRWAEPRLDEAANVLQAIVADPSAAAAKAKRARVEFDRVFNRDNWAESVGLDGARTS